MFEPGLNFYVILIFFPSTFHDIFLLLLQKTKQQKFGADFQTIDLVKRKGRPTKFHVKMPPAAATGIQFW